MAEIEADLKQSKVRNVQGFVFTNPDGSPITKEQIEYQIEKAVKNAGIRKFVFITIATRFDAVGPPRHQRRRGDESKRPQISADA